MKISNKTVIVTGGAAGIGNALARAFSKAGANVVIGDIDLEKAQKLAAEIGAVAVECDATRETDIRTLVQSTEKRFGAVDLFCSNAGVCQGQSAHAASAPNPVWELSWKLHVMAHVYAARAVLPSMIARGEGYFLQIASAAGLLSLIDDAAYSTTKHAAVGFAESLAISHRDDGIKVSVACPLYVATSLLGWDGGNVPAHLMSSETAALHILRGIEDQDFMILPHPEVSSFFEHKARNYERWLQGMQNLRRKILADGGKTDIRSIHKHIKSATTK